MERAGRRFRGYLSAPPLQLNAACLFPDPGVVVPLVPPDSRPAAEMLEETVGLAAVTILGTLEQGERNSG